MTAHYMADTERLGLGRPDHEPLASEYVEPIVALIADLIERGHAYAVDGDVYFRVRSLPEYGELSHRAIDEMDQGEGVEGAARKEDPLDFALWKGEKEDEDTRLALAVGHGPAGLAHRVLGDGGGAARASSSTSTAAAATCSSRTTRTRRRRRWPRAGAPLARALDAQRDAAARRREDGQVGRATSAGSATVLDEVGRDTLLMYFVGGHYRQPIAYTRERLDAAAASVERVREAGRRAGRRRLAGGPGAAARRASSTRWPTTSTPRGRWRACSTGSARPTGARRRSATRTCARCSRCWRSTTCSRRRGAAARSWSTLAERRAEARAAARLRRGGPAARRAARGGLGGPGRPGRAGLVPVASVARVARDRLRRQPGPRGAPRPAGGAADLGGQGGLERRAAWRTPRRERDRRALRLGRPPGRLRGGRGVPLRRRRRAARARPSRSWSRSTR